MQINTEYIIFLISLGTVFVAALRLTFTVSRHTTRLEEMDRAIAKDIRLLNQHLEIGFSKLTQKHERLELRIENNQAKNDEIIERLRERIERLERLYSRHFGLTENLDD